jgi:hypothetical protein
MGAGSCFDCCAKAKLHMHNSTQESREYLIFANFVITSHKIINIMLKVKLNAIWPL